ncbi:hypothetical protein CR513_38490, partial [Mucuna pruriens]
MNCKEIVALAIGKKPVSHLRRMIEDEGIDMVALIRKVKLARGAGAVAKSAKPPAGETSTPRAEVHAAETESAPVAEAEAAPVAEPESALANEVARTPPTAKMSAAETQADGVSAQAETRPLPSDLVTRGAKRKAEAAATEEATQRKGKSIVPPGSPLVNPTEPGRVTITAGPELPPGGLAHFRAPAGVRSLWGPDANVHSLFPPSSIPQYDRRLLVAAGVDGVFETMAAYHLRSLASLEVSKGLVKKAEQVMLKEALNKREFDKMAKANHDLRAEVERSRAEVAKLRADREGLWADLAKSKSEAAFMGGKAAAAEAEAAQLTKKVTEAEAEVANWKVKTVASDAEVARLKTALALAQKSSEALSKDLEAAYSRAAKAEAVVAVDKETKAKLGIALKAAGDKAAALGAEHLTNRVEHLEGALVDQHEAGFEKALQQVALLVPDFDRSPYSVTLEIKDGKLGELHAYPRAPSAIIFVLYYLLCDCVPPLGPDCRPTIGPSGTSRTRNEGGVLGRDHMQNGEIVFDSMGSELVFWHGSTRGWRGTPVFGFPRPVLVPTGYESLPTAALARLQGKNILTESELTGCLRSCPSASVRSSAPPEKACFITYGPS